MAALTANRKLPDRKPKADIISLQMGAVQIFRGDLVMLHTTGFAVGGDDTASQVFAGIAEENIDNSGGSAGDLSIRVRRNGIHALPVPAGLTLAQAHVGEAVSCDGAGCVDLTATTTNDISVGIIVGIHTAGASGIAWVRIDAL